VLHVQFSKREGSRRPGNADFPDGAEGRDCVLAENGGAGAHEPPLGGLASMSKKPSK